MFVPLIAASLFLSSLLWVPGATAIHASGESAHVGVRARQLSSSGSGDHSQPNHPAMPMSAIPLAVGAAVLPRRRLRVVVYARYSRDEQNPRSIDDQVAMCRRHVDALGLGDVEFITITDAALSGEHAHRPGIDQVWELIEKEDCDMIVAEDLSRIYRHATRAMQLIEAAVDADVRVIAINSHIDTEEDEGRWRMSSHFASMKAEADNTETRKRIVRAMDGLWRDGYAVGALKPGYVRIPTTPATAREPARGPHSDQKDTKWTPVIQKALEMCAQDDPSWVVARFLTEEGFPKSLRARIKEWTEVNVIRLVRDPIYCGEETYRVLKNVKKYTQGKSVQVPSQPNEILRRPMPHLAHVSRSLWEAANGGIDRRNTNKNPCTGKNNPNHRRNRDSRTALSEIFVCGVCGAKMYRQGNIYRCANSRTMSTLYRQDGPRCWNRCTPQLEEVHGNLAKAIVGALVSQEGCFEALCTQVVQFVEQGIPEVERRLESLREKEAELHRNCQNLMKAIEQGSGISQLVDQLGERETQHRQVQAEIEMLIERGRADIPAPTGDDIRSILDEVQSKLLGDFDSNAAPWLRRLVDGQIRAIPYRRFDGDSLHLRAHFTLNGLQLMPPQWQQLLDDRASEAALAHLANVSAIPLVVDLSTVPKRIRYAKKMFELVQGGLTIAGAATRLGLPETTGNKAYRTGRAMAERGLDDAYVKITGIPNRPRRWRPHSGRPDVFDAT